MEDDKGVEKKLRNEEELVLKINGKEGEAEYETETDRMQRERA